MGGGSSRKKTAAAAVAVESIVRFQGAVAASAAKTSRTNSDCKPQELGMSAEAAKDILATHGKDLKTWEFVKQCVKPETQTTKNRYCSILPPEQVGPPTVFVSHAYGYDLRLALEAVLQFERNHPGQFYWFDPVSLNQHATGVVSSDILDATFRSNVKAAGTIILVMSPFKDPKPLTRAWCLFEIFVAMDVLPTENIHFHVPEEEREEFIELLANDWGVLDKIFDKIDCANAQAREDKDRVFVLEAVKKHMSFHEVNKRIKHRLRMWVVAVVAEAIAAEEKLTTKTNLTMLNKLRLNASIMLRNLGFTDQALTYAKKHVASLEEIHADKATQGLANALGNLGLVYETQMDYQKAAPLQIQAIEMKEALGASPASIATNYSNLGATYVKLDMLDEGEICHLKALKIREQKGQSKKHLSTTYMNLGNLFVKIPSKYADAKTFYLKGLEIRKTEFEPKSKKVANCFSALGRLACYQKDFKSAEEYQLQAYKIRDEILDARSPDVIKSLAGLVELYREMGNSDKSAEYQALLTKAKQSN